MEKFKKWLPIISRYLLGLIFFLSGLAGLLNLAPPPADLPQPMIDFMTGMMASKYFFPFLKITETVFGLMLIVRVAPALALVVLAPVTIHIFFVHLFLTPGLNNIILPVVMIALHILAAQAYMPIYKPLFKRN